MKVSNNDVNLKSPRGITWLPTNGHHTVYLIIRIKCFVVDALRCRPASLFVNVVLGVRWKVPTQFRAR